MGKETTSTIVKLKNTRPVDRLRNFAGPIQIGRNPEDLLAYGEVREYPVEVLSHPTVAVWLKSGWVTVV